MVLIGINTLGSRACVDTLLRCGKQRQFGCWDAKASKAAIHADQNLREQPDAEVIYILESSEVNVYLGRKLR
jgi:hypothetical protein